VTKSVGDEDIVRFIATGIGGVDRLTANEDDFFFYDPGAGREVDRRLPFATIVRGTRYDTYSDLGCPGTFRLNLGVGKETFRRLFGDGAKGTAWDYTALDHIMPHPEYGMMHWICVVNPSAASFAALRPMLTEAWDLAKTRYDRQHREG